MKTLKQLNISPNELPADFIIQVEAANQKQVFTKPLKQEEKMEKERNHVKIPGRILWGVAASAPQTEGAAAIDGKKPFNLG